MNRGAAKDEFNEKEPLKQLNTVVSHNREVPRSFRADEGESKQQSLHYQRSFTNKDDKKRKKAANGQQNARNLNIIDKKTMVNQDGSQMVPDEDSLSDQDSPPGSFIDDKSILPPHDLKMERSLSPEFLVSPDRNNSPVRPPLTSTSKQQYGINILQLKGSREQLEPMPADMNASLRPSSILTEQSPSLQLETTALLPSGHKRDKEHVSRGGLDLGQNTNTTHSLTPAATNNTPAETSRPEKKQLKSAMKIKTADEAQMLRRERTFKDQSVYSGRSRTKSKNLTHIALTSK